MEVFERLLSIVPQPSQREISWEKIEGLLGSYVLRMMRTQQNPSWHGEGDVWTHTKLVCESVVCLDNYRMLGPQKREVLFLAALLHDIGKIACTRMEDGQWVSPGHSSIGARMARQMLWMDFGLCGTSEKIQFREAICGLIRYHSIPAHAIDDSDGKRKLLRIAANGNLIPDFSNELLCILAEADALGRHCTDKTDLLERIALCKELAEESGCYTRPYVFPSAYTQYAFLTGKNIQPSQLLYDDTWGEVILMSGLPGTGKDTWIKEHYSHYPMISLDGIRRELRASPADNQSRVVDEARRRAKDYLRKKQGFVWNATSLSPMVRQRQLELFTSYHASVKIDYLETEWQEQIRRNRDRTDVVPEEVICRMMDNLVLPEAYEANRVVWKSV